MLLVLARVCQMRCPVLTMYLPERSTETALTGPLCVSIFTREVVMLGLHMLTVPLLWPVQMMPL